MIIGGGGVDARHLYQLFLESVLIKLIDRCKSCQKLCACSARPFSPLHQSLCLGSLPPKKFICQKRDIAMDFVHLCPKFIKKNSCCQKLSLQIHMKKKNKIKSISHHKSLCPLQLESWVQTTNLLRMCKLLQNHTNCS